MNDAKEPLLSAFSGAQKPCTSAEQPNRTPSNRFHVSKSGIVGTSNAFSSETEAEEESCVNEGCDEQRPDATASLLKNEITRASSAPAKSLMNGTKTSPDVSPEAYTPVDEESPTADRGVHFSVGNDTTVTAESGDNTVATEKESNFTINMKSWRNIQTLDHPPMIDFYRNSLDVLGMSSRPSMNQLIHGEKAGEAVAIGIEELKNETAEMLGDLAEGKLEKFKPPTVVSRTKFGWMEGVFVRCVLNIVGVMLYLRLSWVAGEAGILLGMLIVLLASIVTTITAISMCAICTNGDIKGGGAYFLTSRSLGPEYGGSIGVLFAFANAVGAAMYIVGFAETVRDLLKENGWQILDAGMNDVRVIGLVTCIVLMAIVFIGTSFETKMQIGLLVILVVSLMDYFLGTIFPVTEHQEHRGVTGYRFGTISQNLLPAFTPGESFFSVFAIYFPAATGIMAGANISGDLADPQKAIPKGTLLAIAITTVIYLCVVVVTGWTCVRYADGLSSPMVNGTVFEPACAANGTCPYGLINYFQVMEVESFWGPLITAGIFAATLSSALASLVSAPKVFQAVCKDQLFPKVEFFARGHGPNEEPRRACALAFFVAVFMILIGKLNAIAPIISNFFLATYALINYACFDASFANSPGFRPHFRHYNKWVALLGAVLCISVMFVISWSTALLTFFIFAVIFMYISHRKPDVNWGSSTQAHSYKNALQAMIKLSNTEEHVKNYRPQLLVLTGNPAARPSLVDFVYSISQGSSLMICGYVVPYEPCDRVFSVLRKLDRQLNEWLKRRHVRSFFVSVANPSLRVGAQNLLQVSGLGKLRPNILIVGFKTNWAEKGLDALDDINDYFGIIVDAFENNMGVGVLRNASGGGLDYSEDMKKHNVGDSARMKLVDVEKHMQADKVSHAERGDQSDMDLQTRNESIISFLGAYPFEDFDKGSGAIEAGSFNMQDSCAKVDEIKPYRDLEAVEDCTSEKKTESLGEAMMNKKEEAGRSEADVGLQERSGSRRHTAAQRELLASISRFQRKIKGATIDVWWLYDDGGLTLLIPHLLTHEKSYLENARLRVFTIATSQVSMEQEQRSMAALLSKFRIDFSDVSVIPDIGRKPTAQMQKKFQNLIAPFRISNDDEGKPGLITDSELISQKEKTNRQLRTAELLRQHSMDADLIVLTLPVPRKDLVTSCLYMAWLDIMTRDLPPTLLVRGNQISVLTFYS